MVPWCYNKIYIAEVSDMAYFLKKSRNNKGIYLQIYESFYDPDRRQTAHKSFRPIGYVHELQEQGIDDPITHFKSEVEMLNQEQRQKKDLEKEKQISDETPERCLGYFPFKNLQDAMSVKRYVDLLQTQTDVRFNIFSLLSSLVYARLVQPCSKSKTFHDVLPKLYESIDFTSSQMYTGLEFLGDHYEKILEIYAHEVSRVFGYKTDHTYFDCTNYYFEIDQEDDLRRKGPSKEKRSDPLVGMGLLLDANQIPLGMKLYPGNQSEIPVFRNIIDEMKQQHNIQGKTIRVADKGLNCAANIHHAIRHGDGYIMTKSVAKLPEVEKEWVLLPQDYKQVVDEKGTVKFYVKECVDTFTYRYRDEQGVEQSFSIDEKRVVTLNPALRKKKTREIHKQMRKIETLCLSQAKRNEYGDAAKYVNFTAIDGQGEPSDDKIRASLNLEAVEHDLRLAGYNLIVTSEVHMTSLEVYDAYHNLWRIEESFKVMKSQLEARPVYLQKSNTIAAHFLICYIAVLLLRLLQVKIFKNQYSSEAIMEFARTFRTVRLSPTRILNLSKKRDFFTALADATKLPVTSYFLNNGQVQTMLTNRFKIEK